MNPRVPPEQAAPPGCPDSHADQAEQLMARAWKAVCRGDRDWADPNITDLLTQAEEHMLLAMRTSPPTAPTRRSTPTGGTR